MLFDRQSQITDRILAFLLADGVFPHVEADRAFRGHDADGRAAHAESPPHLCIARNGRHAHVQVIRELRAEGDTRLSGTKYAWRRHPDHCTRKAWRAFTALRTSTLKVARAWALKEAAAEGRQAPILDRRARSKTRDAGTAKAGESERGKASKARPV